MASTGADYEDYEGFLGSRFYIVLPIVLLSYVALFGWFYRYLFVVRPRGYAAIERALRFSSLSKAIYFAIAYILVSYLAEATIVIIRALWPRVWTSTSLAWYDAGMWFAWIANLTLMSFEVAAFRRWSWVNYLFFWLALAGETVLAFHWVDKVADSDDKAALRSKYVFLLLFVFLSRYVVLLIATVLSVVHAFQPSVFPSDSDPSRSLLNGTNGYGTFHEGQEEEEDARRDEKGAFADFAEKMKRLLPFLWPKKSTWLQFLIFVCFGLLVLGRIVNVMVPRQLQIVIDDLSGENNENGEPKFAWGAILFYVCLRFLQGGVGLVQATQNYLWIPIGQYTTREISVKMFEHLHGLSLSFHINRKTGEVLRVMDRGTTSIIALLNQILFQIFPVLVDVVVAVVYFILYFGWGLGAIVFVTMASYLYITIAITEWRTKFRREMIDLDNDTRAKAVDSLLNFETVKYYNAERFEVQRYDESIQKYQRADYKVQSSLNLLNLSQNVIISTGLLAGCLICALRVTRGELTIGQFMLFLTYINQLYTPLNFFGTYYRMIQSNFIDMEQMLELFKQQQSVQDLPGASELKVTEGSVVFENVGFSYDSRSSGLKNVSFSIPRGQTVALVGPSGGGKSTILRLLFRFYDVTSGRILIDGQDIRDVTQESLRRNIGVVPQDTVLFNDSIFYNIQYGKVTATENDVYRAAKAAQIHDRILTFSDGYDTRVGERGLRLSGGEKQRVAIARTMLKDPQIILLDEATSALDTATERQIQHALSHMTMGRTTLVIAHRLSTIVNADLILCIKEGEIVESGTHEELIKNEDGVYYEMWQKQLNDESERAAISEDAGAIGDEGSSTKKTAPHH